MNGFEYVLGTPYPLGGMSSRSQKPAPATLGDLKDQEVDVLARCNSCGHNAVLALGVLSRSSEPNTRSRLLGRPYGARSAAQGRLRRDLIGL